MAAAQKHALVACQCFPPLVKSGGGVSKRYLSLVRALIDGLGWQVSLLTPVDVRCSKEPDVERWLSAGSLHYLPARGVQATSSTDGVGVMLDLMSGVNAGMLLKARCYDAIFLDDTPWRVVLMLLARGLGVPTIVTTHTDVTHMESYKGTVKVMWQMHMLSARVATVNCATSRVFGEQLQRDYGMTVRGIWPVCLWAPQFRAEPEVFAEEARSQRDLWLQLLRKQGCDPKAIMLNAGRWSAEKRINLLFDAVPTDCALVIVGDGTSEFADMVSRAGKESGRCNVLPLRKMLNARELRVAYAACDLFLSASNFETLGFTIIESFCAGTPVAIQPAQGHLEYVKDGVNSWFVNYDDQAEARSKLARIVASGLDEASLSKTIPEMAPMAKKFRTSNYAQDLHEALLVPALGEGEVMSMGGALEFMRRSMCLAACVFLWILLWIVTRATFMTLNDPKFEVLEELGCAIENTHLKTVPTLPCLRRRRKVYGAHTRSH